MYFWIYQIHIAAPKHELSGILKSKIELGGVGCTCSSVPTCGGLIGAEEPNYVWFGGVGGSTAEDSDIPLSGRMNFVRPGGPISGQTGEYLARSVWDEFADEGIAITVQNGTDLPLQLHRAPDAVLANCGI